MNWGLLSIRGRPKRQRGIILVGIITILARERFSSANGAKAITAHFGVSNEDRLVRMNV
jgi:hypothetical protein